MPSNTFAYRATICLIWALALWHSWTCRGLFVDGSAFLVQIVRREWFFDFYAPRLYAMISGQIPVMAAVTLGVTDLHLLARLLSFGLFGLPTLFYTFALHRVKDEPVLMAIVIAAIAIVFMTTSFFIVGEYNTAYAITLMVAVRLATAAAIYCWWRPRPTGSTPSISTTAAGIRRRQPLPNGSCNRADGWSRRSAARRPLSGSESPARRSSTPPPARSTPSPATPLTTSTICTPST